MLKSAWSGGGTIVEIITAFFGIIARYIFVVAAHVQMTINEYGAIKYASNNGICARSVRDDLEPIVLSQSGTGKVTFLESAEVLGIYFEYIKQPF